MSEGGRGETVWANRFGENRAAGETVSEAKSGKREDAQGDC